jgi:hypothetical protein
MLLLFVQNGHWIIGWSNVVFCETQIIKFQFLRLGRTDQIDILLQLATNSITDTLKIYGCTRGRVVTLVSRKVPSRVIDLKLPIPVGLPEVRQRSLEQVHQYYGTLLNFPPLNSSPNRCSSFVSSLKHLLNSLTILTCKRQWNLFSHSLTCFAWHWQYKTTEVNGTLQITPGTRLSSITMIFVS